MADEPKKSKSDRRYGGNANPSEEKPKERAEAPKGRGGAAPKPSEDAGTAEVPMEDMTERHVREAGEMHDRHASEHRDMNKQHHGERRGLHDKHVEEMQAMKVRHKSEASSGMMLPGQGGPADSAPAGGTPAGATAV